MIREAKDNCQFCLGAKGGVKGNENNINGVVVCDYCSSLLSRAQQSAQAQEPQIDFTALSRVQAAPDEHCEQPTYSELEAMYFAQCEKTDALAKRLEEGSDRTLLARIADLEAALATMNKRYADLNDLVIRDGNKDSELLEFLKEQTDAGLAPNLVFDDDGHWAVSYSAIAPAPQGSGKGYAGTVGINCVVEPNEWKPSVREAIAYAMEQAKKEAEG